MDDSKLDMSILVPGTSLCLYCGHLRPPGSQFADHMIEEGIRFADGCAFANWRCPTMDGWCLDRLGYVSAHGHEAPEHWTAAPNAVLPPDGTSDLVSKWLARHLFTGSLATHLAQEFSCVSPA